MSKQIIKYPIGIEGEFILIEVESENEDNRVEEVSRIGDKLKRSFKITELTIDESIESLGKLGDTIIKKLRAIKDSPDEIDIQIGLKLAGEMGFVIANISGETQINITIKWKKRNK